MVKNLFVFMQRIGRALMLPVAVLPVAGLLLALGTALAQHASGGAPLALATLMKGAGAVIFANLALIFAIGVALGFTGNDGAAAVAATVGYLVLVATLGALAVAFRAPTTLILGIPSMETGVFGGILVGGLAAFLFNRCQRLSLPAYLGFFAGKRLVPIVTALAAMVLGALLALVWPFLQTGIQHGSHWAAVADPRSAATLYGFVERLLLPFGLHHVWNVPFFFEIGSFTDATGRVVHGDIARFFAGDPSAGILAGAFLFKMFGLPGAALAMGRAARPGQRLQVGSLMGSAALTSLLTGITEPIEFSFMFAAPALYLLHAVLAALCQFLANSANIHMGFTFSQGGLDFLLCNVINPNAQRWGLVLVFGPVTFGLYYLLFAWAIPFFNLRTPGREEEAPAAPSVPEDQRARELVLAFGGRDNITGLDACITRLRVTVRDPARVAAARLQALGATALVRLGDCVQAIFGPRSENLKTDMEAYLRSAGAAVAPAAASQAEAILAALGGRDNLRALEAVAATRLRIRLADPTRMQAEALKTAGVQAMQNLGNGEQDLIVGPGARDLAEHLR